MSLPTHSVPVLFAERGPDALALLGSPAILLIVFGIVVAVELLIAALILQFGCRIIGARVPSLGRAMGIELAIHNINALIILGLTFATMGVVPGASIGPEVVFKAGPIVHSLSLALCTLVSARLYAAFLENVRFRGGLLIWFIKLAIGFLIGFAIISFLVVVVVLGVPGGSMR